MTDAMTDNDCWWEPPLAGTEIEHLVGALDRLRTTFRWKADGLDAAGLKTRNGASSLTLGSLLKHLARVESHLFTTKLSGARIDAPWDTVDWGGDSEWDFTSAADDPRRSSTRSGTARSSDPARGWPRPWLTAAPTSSSTCPGGRVPS